MGWLTCWMPQSSAIWMLGRQREEGACAGLGLGNECGRATRSRPGEWEDWPVHPGPEGVRRQSPQDAEADFSPASEPQKWRCSQNGGR